MQALATRHILSAPVITGRENEDDAIVDIKYHAEGDVLGFMDIRDILLHLLKCVDVDAVVAAPAEERLKMLHEAGAKLRQTALREVSVYGADGNFLHSGQVCTSPNAVLTTSSVDTANAPAISASFCCCS